MKNAFGEDIVRFDQDELTVEQRRYHAGLYVTVPDSEAQIRTLSPVEKTVSELSELGIHTQLDEYERVLREEQAQKEAERIDKLAKEVLENAQVETINPAGSAS